MLPMKQYLLIPAALAFGLASLQAEIDEPARASHASARIASAAETDASESQAQRAIEAAALEAAPVAGTGLAQPIDKNVIFARMYLPKGFGASAGNCDLVIHFHGAPTTMIPAYGSSGLNAALLILNHGATAEPYGRNYADAGALNRILEATRKAINETVPESERCASIGRLALSAWSGGFSAIGKILNNPENVARIDTVLVADGMHAAYGNPRARVIEPRGMTAVTGFARLAAEGEKMMSITHSSVETDGYASTTRAASFVMSELGVEPVAREEQGPREMMMTYRADRKGLHVRGFEGGDAAAHCNHLYAIGETLLPELRERWAAGR